MAKSKTTSGYSKSKRRSLEDFEKEVAQHRQLEDKGHSPQSRGDDKRQGSSVACRPDS
jgi:hypothetical protein